MRFFSSACQAVQLEAKASAALSHYYTSPISQAMKKYQRQCITAIAAIRKQVAEQQRRGLCLPPSDPQQQQQQQQDRQWAGVLAEYRQAEEKLQAFIDKKNAFRRSPAYVEAKEIARRTRRLDRLMQISLVDLNLGWLQARTPVLDSEAQVDEAIAQALANPISFDSLTSAVVGKKVGLEAELRSKQADLLAGLAAKELQEVEEVQKAQEA